MSRHDNHDRERLIELASELADGDIAPERREALRQLLAADPTAAQWYCAWMSLHSQLHLEYAMGEIDLLTSRPPADTREGTGASPRHALRANRTPRWRMAGVAIISGALAASLLVVALRNRSEPHDIAVDSPRAAAPNRPIAGPNNAAARREFQRFDARPVAILSRVADAYWSSSSPMAQGSALPAGRFVLDSGAAQIEFLSGAILVVEGPADFELVTNKLVFCRRGKLRARVPMQAHGFTIETPTHRAVDLGTEFAVDVDDNSTEVHVLDGEVELRGKSDAAGALERRLRLGDGYRALADGRGAAIKADPSRFIGSERLLELSARDHESRYLAWCYHSLGLAINSEVVTYFNFENHTPWQRVLRQDGPLMGDSSDGAIIGCRWTEGRWRDKQALEFKGTEDRVRLNIPGEYDSITLACWVRIDGFDRWLSSLLLTDGHDVGEVHWQFTETGQLLLGVKADANWSQDYLSDVVLRPIDVGRWVHLACVYNRKDSSVAHYLDGRRVDTDVISKHVTLRFGTVELGNWLPDVYHRDYQVRSFNGRMDEFVLFRIALTDEQIHGMYEAGLPNSQ